MMQLLQNEMFLHFVLSMTAYLTGKFHLIGKAQNVWKNRKAVKDAASQ